MSSVIEWADEGVLMLPGAVNVETVPAILDAVEKSNQSLITVDFQQVEQADSVALAMLLCWQNSAGLPLKVINLSAQLETLVQLYDLESVFDVSSGQSQQ
ncbi:MAG: STAS domain-containing protein [Thiotrichales bacterium]|nr:STAS domain-containing protein [Thiotrichales bacterium]